MKCRDAQVATLRAAAVLPMLTLFEKTHHLAHVFGLQREGCRHEVKAPRNKARVMRIRSSHEKESDLQTKGLDKPTNI